MNVRGALAAISLLVGALGCTAPAGEDLPGEEPEPEVPLDITVDAIAIVHGALRISATMVDGAADVSVRLAACDHREVGGGVSTASALVWSLGDSDLAASIGCNLLVRARVRESGRSVSKVAELDVGVGVAPQEGENPDGPQVQSIEVGESGVRIGFAATTPGARLTTGESILEASTPPSCEGDPESCASVPVFTIPRIDFARAFLRGRPLHLDGSSFMAGQSVGNAAIDSEPSDDTQQPDETVAPDEPQNEDPQEAPEDSVPEDPGEEG
jgi:hypothetical protein